MGYASDAGKNPETEQHKHTYTQPIYAKVHHEEIGHMETLLWKQRSNMNKINNQNFVSMPITFLRTMITYKALNAGIRIIEQEESYTSKADLIANDRIPTYGVDDKDASFSGKRIKRGLYRCSNGMILNADCHAAANIMRKAIPDIWKDTRDYTFLSAPDVYGFHKLNPKGIPVKGIAA